jgi:hypothetical protein
MSVTILSGVPATTSLSSSLTNGGLDYYPPSGSTNVVSISQITGLATELTGIKADVAENKLDDITIVTTAPTIGVAVPTGVEIGIVPSIYPQSGFYYADGSSNWALGMTPATVISPAATDAVGTIGAINTKFALEDHQHPAQTISTDANNSLTIGTDGLHFAAQPNNRTHATNTAVVAANTVLVTAGDPTVAEIQIYVTATPTVLDTTLYYTGDDTPTSTPTHVYHVDQSGVVTVLLSAAASSPTVANVIPLAPTDATGAIGVAITEYATEDHKHPAAGVSVDAGNLLTVGTDGLHNLALSAADAIPLAPTDATGAIGTITGQFATEDHKHPEAGVSADANNSLTIGTDGLHFSAAVSTAANAIPLAPTDATGAIGVATTEFALEDHKHPEAAVSADAGNLLTIGTDGLHNLALSVADAIPPAAANAVGAIGSVTGQFATENHQHPAQTISTDASNGLTVGTDGLHHYATIDEVIENAGALAGAAPTGAQLGIDTTTGDQYYVSGGNWTISTGGTAANIINVPAGNVAATDIQSAITELDTEKLGLTGGTMTGSLDMGTQSLTNVALPFSTGVHQYTTTDYQTGNGGNGFLISTGSAPTAVAPTYSFASDIDTGMYWNAGDIAFAINGVDAFVIATADIDVMNKQVKQVSTPTDSGDAVNLGYIDGLLLNRVLATVTGVDLTTVGTTTVYTVPVGKNHIISQIVLVSTANTPGGSSTDPVISFGAGTTIDIVNNITPSFNGPSGTADMAVYLTPDDSAATPNAGDIVRVTVNTPAGHTSLTGTVYIMGFEL